MFIKTSAMSVRTDKQLADRTGEMAQDPTQPAMAWPSMATRCGQDRGRSRPLRLIIASARLAGRTDRDAGQHLTGNATVDRKKRAKMKMRLDGGMSVSQGETARLPVIGTPGRSGATHADDAFDLVDEGQRFLHLLQVGDFDGEAHVRLALLGLGVDADDIELFAGEDF